MKVTNDILMASDNGVVTVLVLLDLSAAFDMVDHNILYKRLEHVVGIKGTALGWFISYLSERFNFVYVDDKSSNSRVICGEPQGSVLGPVILLYIGFQLVKNQLGYISTVMLIIRNYIYP